jgi:hypothetical protein
MARPSNKSIRFRDDFDALYAAVLMFENGSTPKRITVAIKKVFGVTIEPAAIVDWHSFWKRFADERTKQTNNLLETCAECDLGIALE